MKRKRRKDGKRTGRKEAGGRDREGERERESSGKNLSRNTCRRHGERLNGRGDR